MTEITPVHQDTFLRHHVEANDVAVLARDAAHSGERIAAKTAKAD